MKHFSWALVLLASACASPPVPREIQLRPSALEPGAFHIADDTSELVTRRYKVRVEDILTEEEEQRLKAGSPVSDRHTEILGEAVRAIRRFGAPASWDDPQKAVYIEGEEIVVRASAPVHVQIARLIETLKENRSALVRLTVRFVSIRREEAPAIEHLYRIDGGMAGIVETSALDATPFVTRPERRTSAPRITLYHGQAGQIHLGSNYAYIGYQRAPEGFHAMPESLWLGVELNVSAIANGPSADSLLLDFEAGTCEVPDLPKVSSLQLGSRLHELPLKITGAIRSQTVLGKDQTLLLLTGPIRNEDPWVQFILVEATLVLPHS
jgi:hypothetical protein